MMIGPETYVELLKDAEYSELIKERDELIQSIKDFEEKLRNTKTIKDNIITLPGDRKHRAFRQNEEKL